MVSFSKKLLPILVLLTAMISCSHKYDSDILNLSFYQWNQWPDTEADNNQQSFLPNPPSCGWEELHRGNGKLVRIPATIEDYTGISWYHCRFTLPELWQKKRIELMFEAVGPEAEVYLNEKLVGTHFGNNEPFNLDVTEWIYYTLDNHLAIRIRTQEGLGGIGNLEVKSGER